MENQKNDIFCIKAEYDGELCLLMDIQCVGQWKFTAYKSVTGEDFCRIDVDPEKIRFPSLSAISDCENLHRYMFFHSFNALSTSQFDSGRSKLNTGFGVVNGETDGLINSPQELGEKPLLESLYSKVSAAEADWASYFYFGELGASKTQGICIDILHPDQCHLFFIPIRLENMEDGGLYFCLDITGTELVLQSKGVKTEPTDKIKTFNKKTNLTANTEEVEKLLSQESSSPKEFFDFLKMQISDEIKDKFQSAEDDNAALKFHIKNMRLLLTFTSSPNKLADALISLDIENLLIDACRNSRIEYFSFIEQSAVNAITSSKVNDLKVINQIKQKYWADADRNIEAVLHRMHKIKGMVDKNYHYSVFKGQALDNKIGQLKQFIAQLETEKRHASDKSHFDEEDLLIQKLKVIRKKLAVAEDSKISFYRYDSDIEDRHITNISSLAIRERYCLLAKDHAKNNNKGIEEVNTWSNRACLARARKTEIESGSSTRYVESSSGYNAYSIERDGADFQDESLGEYEGGHWENDEYSEMGHDGDDH